MAIYKGSTPISHNVRIINNQTGTGGSIIGAEIDDNVISMDSTWSSQKINQKLNSIETHTHDNKSVLDMLTQSDDGSLLYNGNSISGISEISNETDNALILKDDGLYVKQIQEHTHTNSEIIDKIGVNELGKLLYDGELVATTDVDISQEENNHLEKKQDGLFVGFPTISNDANNRLSLHENGLYASVEDISSDGNNIINRKNDGLYAEIKVSNAEGNILNNENGLFVPEVDNSTLSHLVMKDIGTLTHDELEVIIDQHITNTTLHNSDSLNSILIGSSGFADGTRENCIIDSNSNLSLNTVENKPNEYITTTAKFTSKIYDSSINDCTWVSANWTGQYSLNHTMINVRYRIGSTPNYSTATWSNWIDLGLDKKVTGIGRYIQIEFSFSTDDKNRNVVIKNIQFYFGVNLSTELEDARKSADGTITYLSLKDRLDYLETMDAVTDEEIQAAILADVAEISGTNNNGG